MSRLDGRTYAQVCCPKVKRNVDSSSDEVSRGGRSYLDLYFEIICDIFLRLPIKDLMCCKCVCKTWYKLTRDSEFINMHLKRALSHPLHIILEPKNGYTYTVPNVYYSDGHLFPNLYYADPRNSLFLIDKQKCIPIPVKNLILRSGYTIVGSCNGLLCMASTDITLYRYYEVSIPISIYNPITGECSELPRISPKLLRRIKGVRYGFGFDQISKKYKVVCVYNQRNENTYSDYLYHYLLPPYQVVTRGVIITEGEGSWRTIKSPYKLEMSYPSETVFLDGAFHWKIAMEYGSSSPQRILSLDISTEKLHTINFLPTVNLPTSLILINFAGSLAFVEADTDNNSSSQIWCIVNSRTNGRCLHIYTCKYVTDTNGVEYSYRVLGMLSNGNFLYQASDKQFIEQIYLSQRSDHLALYVPENEQSFIWKIHGVPQSFHTVFLIPTLVSPKAIIFPTAGEESQTRERGRGWERDERRSPSVSPSFSSEWLLRKEAAVRKRREKRKQKKIGKIKEKSERQFDQPMAD